MDCPPFANELIWCETFERPEATAEIVSVDDILEVSAQLVVVVVVEALDGCVLDGAAHPFDLATGLRDSPVRHAISRFGSFYPQMHGPNHV